MFSFLEPAQQKVQHFPDSVDIETFGYVNLKLTQRNIQYSRNGQKFSTCARS